MTAARVTGLLLGSLLLVPALVGAEPKAKARGAVRAGAPAPAEARSNAALSQALQRHVTDAGLTDSLAGYIVTPSLVQLRRYVEAKRVKLVCVVDLSLRDEHGTLLANVRGNVSTVGASPTDAIDAATRAAVARLPQALRALRSAPPSPSLAQARRQWELPLK